MEFNDRLKQIKLENRKKLESLLKEVIVSGKNALKKYYRTRDIEMANKVDDLRLIAVKIGKEIDGSVTSGGRHFDKMVKEVKAKYKK
jgi:hypothetical protein